MLLLGLRIGELTVMSVLAAIVLNERLAKLQVVGLVLALASAAMLALS